MKASKDVLEAIMREGTQKKVLDKLMTRQEFYELIDYKAYEEVDSRVSRWVDEHLSKRV